MYPVNLKILHVGILLTLLATYSHNFFEFGSELAKMVYFGGNSFGLSLIGYYLHKEVKDPIVTFWFFWQVFLLVNRAFLDSVMDWKAGTGLGIILIVCLYRYFRRNGRQRNDSSIKGAG